MRSPCSCTDSLYFALKTAGVSAGDEVIVPAFSFIASASCVLRAGATPKFVDVTAQGNIHAEAFRQAVSEKTKAIIYVHMFGFVDEKILMRSNRLRNNIKFRLLKIVLRPLEVSALFPVSRLVRLVRSVALVLILPR